MPTFESDHSRYHYETYGDGPPLLLLHGFTGSAVSWQGVIERLSPHFSITAVDLPGHGQTVAPDDPSRYRMEHVARDLAALIRQKLSPPVNVLGYSMGGRLALFLALEYPQLIRSLILESASPGLADEVEREARRSSDDTLADRIEAQGIEAFVDYWEAIPLFEPQRGLPDEIRLSLREQRLQNSPRGLANSLRGMGTGVQPSLWGRLGELAIPVMVMAGERDTKFAEMARQMGVLIQGADLRLISEAGHTIHVEKPGMFCECVGAFLRKCGEGT